LEPRLGVGEHEDGVDRGVGRRGEADHQQQRDGDAGV
jgi:hypothetical protein